MRYKLEKSWRSLLAGLLALAFLSQGQETEAQAVPPGFEFLNEPQLTEIDIHYGGYYIVSTLAEFNLNSVTLINPEEVSTRVPDVLNVEALTGLLSRPLDANQQKLCISDFEPACGMLAPTDVGIIFDRSKLRATLFISPDLLETRQASSAKYLPESSAGFSVLNENFLYYSGYGGDRLSYNLLNNTNIAAGESRFALRNNISDAHGFTIDTMAWQREFEGMNYQLGLFQGYTNSFSFMTSENLVGASIESSLLTRADLRQSLGSEIGVFLPSRSRVEIYQDGRLLASKYYDVGNQILDTASLPPGSYEIELRITDASGGTRTETQFFSKSNRLPPTDQALYFLQVGQVVERVGAGIIGEQGNMVLRGGYSTRLTDSMGVGVGLSATEGSTTLHAGFFGLGEKYQLKSGLVWETQGGLGVEVDYRADLDRLAFTLNSRKTWQDNPYAQLNQNSLQLNASLHLRTPNGYLSLFKRVSQRETFRRSNYGIRFHRTIRPFRRGAVSTDLELSRANRDFLAFLSFSVRFNGDGHTTNVASRMEYESNEDGYQRMDVGGNWQSRWMAGAFDQHQFGIRADSLNQRSIEASVETSGRPGAAQFALRRNFDAGIVEFDGLLSSSVALHSRGATIGDSRSAKSAFMISVSGVEESALFEVLVDGSPRMRVQAGQAYLLPVAPYATYEIELRPLGQDLIETDRIKHVKTVYPGNVIELQWSARRFRVVFGKLVDTIGNPITDAIISNVQGVAATDEYGYFQAEIDQFMEELIVRKADQRCVARFDAPSANSQQVVGLGALICSE